MNNIYQYFINYYLTCGQTYDNFIFTNCSIDFIEIAKNNLSIDQDNCNSCIIQLTRDDEILVEQTLCKCKNSYQQKAIARDYICQLIMNKLISKSSNQNSLTDITNNIKAIKTGDIQLAMQYHLEAPLPFDITEFIKNNKKTEIDFFLIDTINKTLQSAINNFVSARTPFSVKIFTNQETLPSYYDEIGNIIESPHDYMSKNPNDFLITNEELEQ